MRPSSVGLGDHLVDLARETVERDRVVVRSSSPPWTIQRRQDAIAWLEAHAFPTRKDEDWRYLPLARLLSVPLQLSKPDQRTTLCNRPHAGVPDLGGPMLVFANGHFVSELSHVANLPEGIVLTRSHERMEGHDLDDFGHAFEALNAAVAVEEVTLRVERNATIETPVQLVYLSTDDGGQATLASPRARLVAGAGCRIHLIEAFLGEPRVAGVTNAVTTIDCHEGARVELDRLQDEADGSWHLSLLDVRLSRDSRLRARSVALGAMVARQEIRVRLAGEGAEVELDGLFLARGEQHLDHPLMIEHLVPKTRSRQRYQGVADERGHGVFNGRVIVYPGAYGTDAEQVNHNLLLSAGAEIDTRPRLEIYDDDVRCTHGATVGHLDESALYYLRCRGIPYQTARAMLIHAAVDETVRCVRPAALQEDIARRVAEAVRSQGIATRPVGR